jgi:hypothetical protein
MHTAEHMKGSTPLKYTLIIKQHSGAMCEMEKLLTMRMEDQIKNKHFLTL